MWMDLLKELLYVIIVVCVPVLTKYLIAFVDVKSKDLTVAMEDTKWDRYRYLVEDYADKLEDVVKTVNQTYVDALKKAGNFDKESQVIAKDKAIAVAKEMLTVDVKDAISMLYANVDTYLDVTIEKFVKENKGE